MDERCRIERHARRRFIPSEGSPSFAADRERSVGLGTRRRRTLVLYPLSYVPEDGGTRTRNHLIKDEGTPVCAAGRLDCQGARQLQRHRMAARPRFERGPPGSEPGVVPVPPPRNDCVRHAGWVWTGGLEPPTPGSRSRCAPVAPRPAGAHGGSRTRTGERHSTSCLSRLGYVSISTDGRIRTDTGGGLGAVPLPVGLRQRGGPCGTRTRNLLLAGELRFLVAPPAHWSRERESNPPSRRMRPR